MGLREAVAFNRRHAEWWLAASRRDAGAVAVRQRRRNRVGMGPAPKRKGERMSKQLMVFGGLKATEVSLQIPPGLTQEGWGEVAASLTAFGHGYNWWLGDLAFYGEHNFGLECIEELSAATGVGVKQLRLFGYTAKKFSVPERVKGLSITHHLRVVHLSPAERAAVLRKALKKAISTRELTQLVHKGQEKTYIIKVRVKGKGHARRLLEQLAPVCKAAGAVAYIEGRFAPRTKPNARTAGRVAVMGAVSA